MLKKVKYIIFGLVGLSILSMLVNLVIMLINPSTSQEQLAKESAQTKKIKNGKEIIKRDNGIQSDWTKSFLVEGEFYQDDKYEREVTLKLNKDNTYSFVFYQSGEVVKKKNGTWRTKILKEKKIKKPISRKILILDNAYLFDFEWVALFSELCVRSYDEDRSTERLVLLNFEERDFEAGSPLGEFIIMNATTSMLCKKYDRTKHIIE